jgi:hypothetical protein
MVFLQHWKIGRIEMMSIDLKYVLIFFVLLLTDAIWTLYIRWAAEGKAFRAAVASVLIYIIGAFTIGEFIKDHWVAIPASLGCFLGTYITIIVDREKENPDPVFGKNIRDLINLFRNK